MGRAAVVTSPRQIRIQQRKTRVLELRLSGLTFDRIADTIRADAEKYNVSEGYQTQHAYRDLRGELANMREVSTEEREEARQIEVARLDVMLKKLWDEYDQADISTTTKALGETQGPALWILDRILKIQERRAKYLGLDEAIKHSMSFDESSVKVVVEKLLGILKEHVKDGEVLGLIASDLNKIDWIATTRPQHAALEAGDDGEAALLD